MSDSEAEPAPPKVGKADAAHALVTIVALRNHQKDKLDALQNAVVNSARGVLDRELEFTEEQSWSRRCEWPSV